MKPCIIIKGLDNNIEDFENKIFSALEQGYEISGDLITHVISDKNGNNMIILLQPMFLSNNY